MISIHCTHCRQMLEMDDAFAGGVCRCQYCGTIQTVPSKKSRSGSGKSSSSSSSKNSSTKALYKKGTPAGAAGAAPADSGMGTGLDDLAQVVASSGLARGSLRKPPPRRRDGGAGDAKAAAGPAAPRPAKPSLPRSVLIGGAAGVVLLLVAVIYFATRPGDTDPTAKPTGTESVASPVTPELDAPPAPPPGPTFAGVPLEGAIDVVYLIDRSQSNDEYLDAVKVATYESVRTLGPKGRFQIIFWHLADEGMFAYPDNALAPATPAEVAAAKRRFEDVVAYRTTDLKPTMEKAAAVSADAIVLVTAKGFSLEESNVETVIDALGGRPVKVHAISLGDAESPVLKEIAERTDGSYRALTLQELRTNRR